jgi:TolB-like protein/Flp pilus assembly protein TadD
MPDSPSPHTAIGAVLGTAGYMSPEQARGRGVDFRSDQFVAGPILYEMATGRQAFRRETPAQTIAAIIDATPEPLQSANPLLPAPARWIVERCLAKEPSERYASTLDLARELRDVRERLPEIGSSGSLPRAAVSLLAARLDWRRAARVGAVAAAVVALALGARALWTGHLPPLAPDRAPVVAVLPLTNLTGTPEDDAAAVGIQELVVAGLSEVEGVHVLARLSTAAYGERKRDLPGLARALDARYLVDGTLQRSRDSLRVSFSLVDTPSNVVRWSDTFDGASVQLFELQSRVAVGVAHALRVSVAPGARARIEARPTASPSAWDDFSAALLLLERTDRPGNAERAVARLEAALRAGPALRPGPRLARPRVWERYEDTGDAAWADRARDEVQEAIRLDPGTRTSASPSRGSTTAGEAGGGARGGAQGARSDPGPTTPSACSPSSSPTPARPTPPSTRPAAPSRCGPATRQPQRPRLGALHRRAIPEATGAYRRQTELQPDNAWAFQMLGTSHLLLGRARGSGRSLRRGHRRLAPDARAWANLAYVYLVRGDVAEAVRGYEEAARIEPLSGTIRRGLGDARAKAGDARAAAAEWRAAVGLSRTALGVNPRDSRQLKNVAICLAKLGERDEALRVAAEALEAGADVADTRYGVATVHAVLGDTTSALAELERALALGTSPFLVERDDELAPLRQTPGFRDLVRKAKARQGREVRRAS